MSSFISTLGKAVLFKLDEVNIHKSSSSTACVMVHSSGVPSFVKERELVGHSKFRVPFICNPEISTLVDPLNSGMNSIVTLVPFARTSPTLTLPKEDCCAFHLSSRSHF